MFLPSGEIISTHVFLFREIFSSDFLHLGETLPSSSVKERLVPPTSSLMKSVFKSSVLKASRAQSLVRLSFLAEELVLTSNPIPKMLPVNIYDFNHLSYLFIIVGFTFTFVTSANFLAKSSSLAYVVSRN